MKTSLFLLPLAVLLNLTIGQKITYAQAYQPSNRVPIADSTLGTQVSGNSGNFMITGGINRGQNLFHSFQDFSVPTNGVATFVNPAGNQSIITRVTGTSLSDINGTINMQGANFLLINPNGVVFGPNTTLNVGRVFAASTANGLDLVDGTGKTVTFGTNAAGDAPLLTVKPDVLFSASRLNMGGGNGAIRNFGNLQTNNSNQYIGLVGGNISFNGGQINAPGGRVELGGLSAPGSIGLGTDRNNPRLSFPVGVARSDVLMNNVSRVNVASAGNGNIVIMARNINLSGGSLIRGGIEQGLGTPQALAGDIRLDATDKTTLTGISGIVNNVRLNSMGRGGDIRVDSGYLSLQNSGISTSSNGSGDAGHTIINTKNAIVLSGADILSRVEAGKVGNSGNISIDTNSLSLTNGSQLSTSTYGLGNAGDVSIRSNDAVTLSNSAIFSTVEAGGIGQGGNININSHSLSLMNGSQLLASVNDASATRRAGIGNAGNVSIRTIGAVDITGKNKNVTSGIRSSIGVGAEGDGGSVNFDVGSFSLREGAEIISSSFGRGNAGNLTVKAKNAIILSNAHIFSRVESSGIGNAGHINVTADVLSLANGSQLSASTYGLGNAGNVNLRADDTISLSDKSVVFSTVEAAGIGQGGNIDISSSSLSLTNSQLVSSTYGLGRAGDINIRAKNTVSLSSNSTVFSTVEAGGVGQGGNININSNYLSLADSQLLAATRKASITQQAGIGNAGNIDIVTKDTVSLSNSVIFSRIETRGVGRGGHIDINTAALSLTNDSQLSTSTAGVGDAGNINVRAKDTVSLSNRSALFSTVEAGGLGQGGSIDINSNSLTLASGSQLVSSTREASANQQSGRGNAGDINIKVLGVVDIAGKQNEFTSGIRSAIGLGAEGNGGNINFDVGSFSLREGAVITSSTAGHGNAGNLTIKADGGVVFSSANIFSRLEAGGVGKGGDVNVNAHSLFLINAQIQTLAQPIFNAQSAGRGDAGNVNINVTGTLDISSTDTLLSAIGTLMSEGTNGNAGNITVDAGSVYLHNFARLESSTFGEGSAGVIKVNAVNSITINGKNGRPFSGFLVGALGNTGSAGDIIANASRIVLDNNSIIDARSSSGNGGNIAIGSSHSLANPADSNLLLLRHGARISTNAGEANQQSGNGGNININSNFIVAIPNENSDITANAVRGRGGNVNINAQGLFGIQFRAQPTSNSDITASSDFGQSGNVSINTPGIDPGKDTSELPTTPTDASRQIAQSCNQNQLDNKFYVTGRGGHPSSTNEPLTNEVVWSRSSPPLTTTNNPPASTALQPAAGWVINGQGKATLVAANTEGSPNNARVLCPTTPNSQPAGSR
jgi:filamentous hemagglutinin family protein